MKLDGDTIILPVEGPYTEDFDCGDVVTLTAVNGEPCQFQYWSIGHEVNQELVYDKLYDKEITFTMDSDYYAVLYCSPSPEPSPEPTTYTNTCSTHANPRCIIHLGLRASYLGFT